MKMKGFTQTSDWVYANVEHTGPGPKSLRCMIMVPEASVDGVLSPSPSQKVRCTHPGWSSKSSSDTIRQHFETCHNVFSPVKRSSQSVEQASQASILSHLKRARDISAEHPMPSGDKLCFSSKDDCFALAFAMNPTHALEVVDDPYWRVAFGEVMSKCSKIRCRHSLRDYILQFAERLEEHRKKTLIGIVGLQMDAGKDVNSRKLVASAYMHPSTRRSIVHKLLDTELETLTEQWHANHIASTILELMRGGRLFVPSVTLDNESSQNAGLRSAIIALLPWLLHFRCGAHSIELLLKYLFECLPSQLHSDPCNAATQLVSKFRNTKALSQALYELQKVANPNARPLVLVQACRTRKWSADYLVVARVLRLQPFLTTLFQSEAHQAALGEMPDWQLLSAFCKRAFPLYLCEQILQRDSSNAVHLAFFWKRCYAAANAMHDEVTGAVQQFVADGRPPEEFTAVSTNMEVLKRKLQKRDDKMRSCKVFDLCSIMWPSVIVVPGDTIWQQVQTQLHDFISSCFSKWIEFREVVSLPSSATEQDGYMIFFLQAVRELAVLTSSDDITVTAAKSLFNRDSQLAERMFADHGDNSAPQPYPTSESVRRSKKRDIYSSLLQDYWNTFRHSHPHAYFIFNILSHCCATEAGTERMFSSEKQIHSAIRQAMSPDLTEALMRIRWNFEPLMQFLGLRQGRPEENDVEELRE